MRQALASLDATATEQTTSTGSKPISFRLWAIGCEGWRNGQHIGTTTRTCVILSEERYVSIVGVRPAPIDALRACRLLIRWDANPLWLQDHNRCNEWCEAKQRGGMALRHHED